MSDLMERLDHLKKLIWDMFETSWDFLRHPMLPCAAAPELTP